MKGADLALNLMLKHVFYEHDVSGLKSTFFCWAQFTCLKYDIFSKLALDFFGTFSLSNLKNLSSLWSCPTMGCSKRVLVFLSTALQGNFSLRWAEHIKNKNIMYVHRASLKVPISRKQIIQSICFPELFKGIKGPSPWRWFSICQEGWNSYGQVKLQRISERLKISLSLPRFGWFYKRNGTTWSDGRVGPKNGVFLEILQYPGHNGNWQ